MNEINDFKDFLDRVINSQGVTSEDEEKIKKFMEGTTVNGDVTININAGCCDGGGNGGGMGAGSQNTGGNPGGGNNARARNAEERRNRLRQNILDKNKSDFLKTIVRVAKSMLDPWLKIDKLASDVARSVGMTAAARSQFRKKNIDIYKNEAIGIKYNVSMEDMMKGQQGIMNASGRQVGFSKAGIDTMAAMTSVIGGKDTTDFITKLDNFGIGMKDTGRIVGDMFNEASESGLDFETYSKNFLDNIAMAQTYNFKNGVEGVKSMAKRATELQLSMKATASFADKVRSVEGALNVGAQLQALGGSFAQFANPLAMMSESLTDTEALQDRLVNMFSRQGRFDRSTGEVKFDPISQEKGRVAAEAIGVDFGEMQKMAGNVARRKELSKELNRSGITMSDKERELFLNKGTFQDGKAGYVDREGNFKEMSKLSEKDFEEMKFYSQTQGEHITEIARNSMSALDEIEGIKKQVEGINALLTEKTLGATIDGAVSTITKNSDLIKDIMLWGVPILGIFKILGSIRRGIDRLNRYGLRGGGGGGGDLLDSAGDLLGNGKGKGFTGKGMFRGKKGLGRGERLTRNITAKIGRTKAGKAVMKKVEGKAVGTMVKGAGVLAAAGQIAYDGYNMLKSLKSEDTKEQRKQGYKLAGNVIGTTIGAVFGGPVGAAIGSTIGRVAGEGISKLVNKRREKKKEEFGLSGLEGDYSVRELKKLRKILEDGVISSDEKSEMSQKLIDKFVKSGDINKYEIAHSHRDDATRNRRDLEGKVTKMADGGWVNGPSHAEGGALRLLEGGEFVISKLAARALGGMLPLLNSLVLKPNLKAMKRPLSVLPKLLGPVQSTAPSEIKVSPIDIKISGTIKLDTGNGSVDISKEISSSPSLIRSITDMIAKQLNINDNVRYKKEWG